jgi:hypothetical protein
MIFFPLVEHAWKLVRLHLHEEEPTSIHLRAKLILATLGMPKWV